MFQVRWRINEKILDTVLTCLREKIAVGDLPVLKDIPLPPVPEGVIVDGTGRLKAPSKRDDEEEEDFKERRKAHYTYKRLVDKVGADADGLTDRSTGFACICARRLTSSPIVLWISPCVFGLTSLVLAVLRY